MSAYVTLVYKFNRIHGKMNGLYCLSKTNGETSTVLCCVVIHLERGRALKKKGEPLDYVSRFAPILLSCSTAS